MIPRKPLLLVAAAFLLAAISVGLLIARRQSAWFSDPATPRFTSEYQQILFDAPTPVPVMPSNFLNGITLDRNDLHLTIQIHEPPDAHRAREFLDFERVQVEGTEPVALGAGSVRLAFIAVGYGAARTNFDYSFPVPARFFGPDLAPLNHEQIKKTSPRASKNLDFAAEYPVVEFCFAKSNLTEIKPLTFHVFDARTHQNLGRGSSTRSEETWFQHGLELRAWHQTPVHIVATFATAPLETVSIPGTEGAEARFGNRFLRVLAILERQSGGWSSSSSAGTNTVTLRLPGQEDTRFPAFTILTVEWPKAYPSPIELEVFDKAGKKMTPQGGGSMDYLRLTTLRGSPADIGEIRLNHFTKTYRAVFDLPEIPGLPEENRNLKNLFHARIPYMRVDYEHELQEAVQSLTAMNMNHLPLVYTNGYFPLYFTNATPADLLKEIETILSPNRQLIVNQEENTITHGMTLLQQLAEKARSFFN